MTTNETFAERLTGLREKSGKKRQEVADDIGISRASLEYYEKGRRKPDIDVLLKLADYYKVTCDYLVRGIESENLEIHSVTGLSNEALECLNLLNQVSDENILLNQSTGLSDESIERLQNLNRLVRNKYKSKGKKTLEELAKEDFEVVNAIHAIDFLNSLITSDNFLLLSDTAFDWYAYDDEMRDLEEYRYLKHCLLVLYNCKFDQKSQQQIQADIKRITELLTN